MQNNFECIFKLVVALTFLMCVFNVCCLFALSVFLFNVLHYIFIFFFFFFVCFIFSNERQQKERKKKRKKRKKVESRIKFSIWKPFWSNYFFILINQGNGFCN